MKITLIASLVITFGVACACFSGVAQEPPRVVSAKCLGDNIFLREATLDNAIWWDPTTGDSCPIGVEEAIRLAFLHGKKPNSDSVHPIAILRPCARIFGTENDEVITARKSRYLYWVVRLVHDQGFEGGKQQIDTREYVIMFNK